MEVNIAQDKNNNHTMENKNLHMIPVTLQIFLLVIPFLLAGGIFLWQQSQKMFEQERLKFGQTLLMEAAVLEAGQIDGKKLSVNADLADKAYFAGRAERLQEETWLEIEGMSRGEGEEDYRTALFYGYFGKDGKKIFPILDMEPGKEIEPGNEEEAGKEQELEWVSRCIQSREAISFTYSREQKSYLALYVPVFSDAGLAVGAVKCSLEIEPFVQGARIMAQEISYLAIGSFSVTILAVMVMAAVFLRPIRQLKFFLKEVGEKGNVMHLHRRGYDEISELLEILSRMSENIHEYMSEVKRLQNRYRAFVPEELVLLLGKSDIREVKAGDQALCEGTLAVIPVGDSLKLPTAGCVEKRLQQMNRDLEQIIPEIEQSQGQILRFFQGGVLAFFPEKGNEAVVCIGRILQKLQANTTAFCSAAMDYRKIHLEVSGDDSRLQFTIHRKDWEEIKTLSTLAQKHHLAMVGGMGLDRKLKEEESPLFVRPLGRIRCSGEENTMELIELFAEKKEYTVQLIREMSQVFARGVDEFQQCHFREGRECFAQILRKNHNDHAARRYFILCDQRLCGENQGEKPYFD